MRLVQIVRQPSGAERDTLIRFVEEWNETLPAGDKRRFATLLELPDPDLHAYIVGRHEPPDPDLERLLGRIRACRPT